MREASENIPGVTLANLMQVAAISEVAFIDDTYAGDAVTTENIESAILDDPERFRDIIPALKDLDPEEVEAISVVVAAALENEDTLDAARGILGRAAAVPRDAGGGDEALDRLTSSAVDDLLEGLPDGVLKRAPRRISGAEWASDGPGILDEVEGHILLLIDQSFAREGLGEEHGIGVIADAVSRAGDRVYCALLTHRVSPRGELQAWQKLASTHEIPRNRFVVISKRRLGEESPDWSGFLRLVRLAILSGPLDGARNLIQGHLRTAIDDARTELEDWTVFDFDEAVIGSSRSEGLWEGETLLRVLNTFIRYLARPRILADSEVRGQLEYARAVSAVQIGSGEPPEWRNVGRVALKYQRLEMYEDLGAYGGFHLPLEIGDVFEETNGSGKKFLLLAQPCDLMVRSGGRRSYDDGFSRMVPLCEIRQRSANSQGQSFELKYWGEQGESCYVDFSRVHLVKAAALDLCTATTDGVARFDLEEDPPSALAESWTEHLRKLYESFSREYRSIRAVLQAIQDPAIGLSGDQRADAMKRLAPPVSNTGKLRAALNERGFTVNVRRIRRVAPEIASEALRAFARFQSRTAFDASVFTPAHESALANGAEIAGPDDGARQ